jgi:hypothetical protein
MSDLSSSTVHLYGLFSNDIVDEYNTLLPLGKPPPPPSKPPPPARAASACPRGSPKRNRVLCFENINQLFYHWPVIYVTDTKYLNGIKKYNFIIILSTESLVAGQYCR